MKRAGSPIWDEGQNAGSLPASVLLRGRIELLRAQFPFVLAGNVLVSSIAAWVLRDRFPPDLLLGWVAAIATVALVRWLMDIRLARLESPNRDRLRLSAFALGSLASGLLWGSVAFWLLPAQDPLYSAMIVLLLAGMTAGAVPALSPHAIVYACYATPTLVPVTLVYLLGSGSTVPGAGIFLLLFLMVNLSYSLILHRNYGETIARRHENARLVEQLREQMRIAREADVAKSRFLAAASHDLRQPLHAMGLFLDTLQSTLETERQKYLMCRARQSADALQDLFNALLDISRLDAGAVEVLRQPVDVSLLLAELRHEFEPQAKSRGLALEIAPAESWVDSDPVLLLRILRNLLSNAIRYTDEGVVSITGQQQGGRLQLSVEDTGAGIAPADRQRIFEEFQQLDNPGRNRAQGLGLGLAIVQRLCQLLDHPLTLDSRPGEGSCFRLTLPVTAPPEEESFEPDSCHLEWSGRVLLVDDEPEVLDALGGLLTEWGISVQVAEDEETAQAMIQEGYRPELLITDYRLRSGAVGLELVRWARSMLGDELGVLLITGDTAAQELAQFHAQGLQVLNKPIRAAELRRAIDREMEVQRSA